MVLGLETSGEIAGMALVRGEEVLAQETFRHEMKLSRDLLPRLDALMQGLGLRPQDLGGVAVSLGPGSFTGLRIGVTAAKTLAYSLGIPVAGVGTLHALGAEHPAPPPTLCCVLLDAGEQSVFAALFQWTEQGLEPRAEELQLPIADLVRRVSLTPLQVVAVGAVEAHGPVLREALGPRLVAERPAQTPSPTTVARLGAGLILRGATVQPHDLAPRYLRPSTPEARLARRG